MSQIGNQAKCEGGANKCSVSVLLSVSAARKQVVWYGAVLGFYSFRILPFFLQGDEEKGRALIKEGIKMREELGVSLYLAAGNCDLGSE